MKLLLPVVCCLLLQTGFSQNTRFDPPWNPAPTGTPNFTVKGVDNLPDIYGDINDPELVVFMGGNQFMLVDDLIKAFKAQYPQFNRILIETLPPGVLFEQMQSGTLVVGNMRISLQPDVYTAGMSNLQENRNLFDTIVAVSANKLALMVAGGNPKNIKTINDLARKDVRISMPNKRFEGIANNIEAAYRLAGGDALHEKIMVEKRSNGTTFLTQIHHRQSPMRLLYDQSDVAPVWETEIIYQQMLGNPVEAVALPDSINKTSVTGAAVLKQAPHKAAANHFVQFLASAKARDILLKYGFELPAKN